MTAASSVRQRGIPGYLRSAPGRVVGLPSWVWTLIIVVAGLGFVEVVARLGVVSRTTLIPVTEMIVGAAGLLATPSFYLTAVLPSLASILLAFVIASVVGIAAGYVVWRFALIRLAVDPYLTAYYAIPVFALYPAMIALWGQGIVPITALAAIFAVVAVIMSAMTGFDSTPPVIRKLAQSMEVGGARYFFKFLLPYSLPHILVGLRLAFLYAFLSVLAAEFLLSSYGLGFFIQNAYVRFAVVQMFGAILIVIVLAVVLERLITYLVRRLSWIGAQP